MKEIILPQPMLANAPEWRQLGGKVAHDLAGALCNSTQDFDFAFWSRSQHSSSMRSVSPSYPQVSENRGAFFTAVRQDVSV